MKNKLINHNTVTKLLPGDDACSEQTQFKNSNNFLDMIIFTLKERSSF